MMDPWAGVALSTGMIIFISILLIIGVYYVEIKSYCCPAYKVLEDTEQLTP